jgi:membrane associated rhomboid family serine protease
MWVIALINILIGGRLTELGIAPRQFPFGLLGILVAPFVHSSIAHLGANSIPFFVTSAIINGTRGTAHYLLLSVGICLTSGLMVWTFGRSSTVHVGVSSTIFGYVGFLCIAAAIERNITNVAIAIVVVFMYGSMLFGIFPTDEQVSWEGHLFGFLMGGLISYIYCLNTSAREQIDRVADDITIGASTDGERAPILSKSLKIDEV